ncbi:MAG: hypothetical protein ABW007_12965 [Chitinophagaceae bacterium]
MKRIFKIAGIMVLFASCQPNFEDPELKDQVELLENRIVKLEAQLKTMGTTIRAASYSNEDKEERPVPQNTSANSRPVEPTRINPSTSADYTERSSGSSQRSSSSSWRCQATTRKGTQCKRTSRSGNYCWQHGG